MTGHLPPVTGHYVDRDHIPWTPSDTDGGPMLSGLHEVEQLSEVLRKYGPVEGHFQATTEEPS